MPETKEQKPMHPRLTQFVEEHLPHHDFKAAHNTLSKLGKAERKVFDLAKHICAHARQNKGGYSPEMHKSLEDLAVTLNSTSSAIDKE